MQTACITPAAMDDCSVNRRRTAHQSLPPSVTKNPIMSVERRGSADRRTGKDRRQEEKGPPTNFERRRAIEARQPELTELHMSEDELKALGFAPTPTSNPRKTG